MFPDKSKKHSLLVTVVKAPQLEQQHSAMTTISGFKKFANQTQTTGPNFFAAKTFMTASRRTKTRSLCLSEFCDKHVNSVRLDNSSVMYWSTISTFISTSLLAQNILTVSATQSSLQWFAQTMETYDRSLYPDYSKRWFNNVMTMIMI